MNQRIDQFRDNLRGRLAEVDNRIRSFKEGLDTANATAKAEINEQLDKAKADFAARKRDASAAHERIRSMLEEKKEQTATKVEAWVREREIEKMEARARLAEEYAAEQILLATATIEEAEVAMLEALAARVEADELAAS